MGREAALYLSVSSQQRAVSGPLEAVLVAGRHVVNGIIWAGFIHSTYTRTGNGPVLQHVNAGRTQRSSCVRSPLPH
jgi:hypothetical protein